MTTTAKNVSTNASESEWQTIAEPYPDTWDFRKTPVLTGVFTSRKEIEVEDNNRPGEMRKQMVYTVATSDGKKWGVWGSNLLDEAFQAIGEGQEVRIEFFGKTEINDGKQQFNRYLVQTK